MTAYDNLIKFFNAKVGEVESELNKHKKHSYINTENIRKDMNKSFEKIKENISGLKNNHPNLFNEDPIKDFLTELFDKKITTSYDNERLEKIFKEGKIRYDKEIPPGYKDYKDKKCNEESSLYGDLIIWFQIIDFAKEKSKPIVFVTDDLKEDWWNRYNGKTIGPRIELLKEFNDKTQQKILIYNADTFLTIANKQIGADIDESTINEIKGLRLNNEHIINAPYIDDYANYLDIVGIQKNRLFKQDALNSKNSYDISDFKKFVTNNFDFPDEDFKFYKLLETLPKETRERLIRQYIKSIRRNRPDDDDLDY